MQVKTSRFGTVEIQPEDILLFSRGLIGFESHRHWVLLADSGIVALHTLKSGLRRIALPRPHRVTDLITGDLVSPCTAEIYINLDAPTTCVYRLEEGGTREHRD